jgi:predicted metal-dependent peptidase
MASATTKKKSVNVDSAATPVTDFKDLESRAAKAISEARFLMNYMQGGENGPGMAFVSSLMMWLQMRPSWGITTACTDGKAIAYNPAFVLSLSRPQLIGLIAHEVLHVALGHIDRVHGRKDLKKWNVATDLKINHILEQAKFTMPEGALKIQDQRFARLKLPVEEHSEYYYERLDAKSMSGIGDGVGDFVFSVGTPEEMKQLEEEIRMRVGSAKAVAKSKGKLPESLSRLIDEMLEPKIDWREVLRDFVQRSSMRTEYDWSRPNRRWGSMGIYMPSMKGQSVEGVVVAVDTSGSIGDKELAMFAAEVEGIMSVSKSKLTILYCDCAIQGVQEWTAGDGKLTLTPKGGGGTSHRPVWEWVDNNIPSPSAVICLTDLWTDFGEEPNYPVLWAAIGGRSKPEVPWGTLISIDGDA